MDQKKALAISSQKVINTGNGLPYTTILLDTSIAKWFNGSLRTIGTRIN